MSGNGYTGYKSATPNSKYVSRHERQDKCIYSAYQRNITNYWYRGHYSDAVLSHLESQNEEEVEGITAKVRMLKDVGLAAATARTLWSCSD